MFYFSINSINYIKSVVLPKEFYHWLPKLVVHYLIVKFSVFHGCEYVLRVENTIRVGMVLVHKKFHYAISQGFH